MKRWWAIARASARLLWAEYRLAEVSHACDILGLRHDEPDFQRCKQERPAIERRFAAREVFRRAVES